MYKHILTSRRHSSLIKTITLEERYDVFSNITDVYNDLIAIKIERLKNACQKEIELAQLNNDKRDIFAKIDNHIVLCD